MLSQKISIPIKKPMVFVHLEKTAGTAFQYYLHQQFSDNDIAEPYRGGDVYDYFKDQEQKKLFYGHLSYSNCKKAQFDAHYITFLRDPIKRAFSQYCSWHNPDNLSLEWRNVIPQKAIEAVETVQQLSFDEYVKSDNPYIYNHISNLYCQRLSPTPWGPSSSVDSILEAVETEFTWFGVVERFDESMKLFCKKFTVASEFNVPDNKANISIKYDNWLSDEGLAKLIKRNEKDIEFYDKALNIFESRLD